MHHQREVSSPQEQVKGSHPQSDGITEVVQVDCSRERGEGDSESRQRVCCVPSQGFQRHLLWALQCYISIDVEGPPSLSLRLKEELLMWHQQGKWNNINNKCNDNNNKHNKHNNNNNNNNKHNKHNKYNNKYNRMMWKKSSLPRSKKSLDMAIWMMMTLPLLPLLLPWLMTTMSQCRRTIPIPMKQLATSLANGGIPGFVHDDLQFATILSRR